VRTSSFDRLRMRFSIQPSAVVLILSLSKDEDGPR